MSDLRRLVRAWKQARIAYVKADLHVPFVRNVFRRRMCELRRQSGLTFQVNPSRKVKP